MLFSFFRDRRRKQILDDPFPQEWLPYLHANVPHYDYLAPDEQQKLQNDARIFLHEKHWEGCGGLTLTDEVRVTISAQASLLTLSIPHDYYPNVESVLVYPAAYRAPESQSGPGGVVDEGHSARLGEAWQDGPIVLSWADAHLGGRNPDDGRNVVLHEFAHKLDMADGRVEGTPCLHDRAQYDAWFSVMTEEYERLVEQSERGQTSVLDDYGATNAGEFFAVATECFFEKPRQLHRKHRRLYDVLRNYYQQDTAARVLRRLREERHGRGRDKPDADGV